MTERTPQSLVGTRVAILQPLLPRYRVPVFDLLARTTGIDLTVICDMHPKGSLKSAPATNNFRCEQSNQYRLGPALSQPAMLSTAMGNRFDAAVFTWNTRILELMPALLACKATGKGSVLWGHGYSKRDSPVRRALRRNMLRFADSALLYGRAERSRLVDVGWDANKIFVAPNAIEQVSVQNATAAWKSEPERLRRWQAERGIIDGKLVVFISRIEADKRVDLLLDAFARLTTRQPDLRLGIIGGGSCLDKVRRQSVALGIESRTTFTGPIYDEGLVAPWCLSAGCLAYPEAIGLSIYHAFGYGLPVVTSDNISSHNPEIESLRDGVNGLLYAHRDVDAFARAIERLLNDPRGREGWRKAALDTVHAPDGYNILSMVNGYADALRHALSRHPSRIGRMPS